MQKNYCEAIYKGLYVSSEPNNQAKISSCCVNQTGPAVSVVDFQNNEYLSKQRKEFNNGSRPSSCDFCWRKEDLGLISAREVHNADNATYVDPYEIELITLHYNVAPLCNAKCITCGSHFSSAWAAEDEKFHTVDTARSRSFNLIHKSHPQFDVDFSRLRQVYFNGGEPFLSTEINKILNSILEQQGSLEHLSLVINTNSSVMPTRQDVALWNQCQSVLLICSIEAVGPQFEYIRYPLSWTEVADNLLGFGKLFDKQLKIHIAPNLGIHNALEYQNLVSWFNGLEQENTSYALCPELTVGVLSFDQVSAHIKAQLLQRIPLGSEFSTLRQFITNSCHGDDSTWMQHLEFIDQRRGLDWHSTFLDLSEIALSR